MGKEPLRYKKIQTVLVALDFTEMDQHLFDYVSSVCHLCDLERVIFVYVAKSLELPGEVLNKYPDLMAPMDESLRHDIEQKVKQHFKDGRKTKVDIHVLEGSPIEQILHYAKIKHADAIFMGRKRELKGSGIVSSHVTRNSSCSLIMVPENPPLKVRHILVPVDFSRHAGLALKHAHAIAQTCGSKVECIHLYDVPSGYHYTGKTYEQFAEIMKGHAETDYKKFLRANDIDADYKCHFILNEDDDSAEIIFNFATENNIDFIVLGSRGRTDAAVILMGSLAEKITYLDADIPLFIVKDTGENLSFLEALLRI